MKPSFRFLAFLTPNGKLQLRASRISCCLFSLGAFALTAVERGMAASATWNGTTDSTWATTTNWISSPSPSSAPGSGETATFNSAGNGITTISLSATTDAVTIQNILFDTSNAAAYTLGAGAVGSQTFTLNTPGAITVSGSVTKDQRVNANLELGLDKGTGTFTLTNNSATNSLTLAGAIQNSNNSKSAGIKSLLIGGIGSTTVSGNINEGVASAVVNISKSESGTLTLSGANTYTGGTTVSEGKLLVNNTTGSGTGTGAVSVTTGATLGGTGIIKPSSTNGITVASTGKLAPGANNSIGKLTVDLSGTTGNVTMSSGSLFDWQLSGNGGTPDQVSIVSYGTGDFVLNNNAINFALTGTEAAGNYTVTLFRFFSDVNGTLPVSGITSGLALGTLTGSFSGTPTFDYATTGEVRLNYSVVPEPTSALAGILLGAGLLRRKRR